MFITGFPADAFGTNCYVVAPARGEQCVVIDPGIGVVPRLEEVLREHRLQPVAVLLTHGHLDHTFSVTPVCGARDIPAYIHPSDRELLAHPERALAREHWMMLGQRLQMTEPDDVQPLADGAVLRIAGLEITVDHAPGHTRGSVMFRLPGQEDYTGILLSGDVLFAGSIGRTDLPGGSYPDMLRSLATKVLPLADTTLVLPGHGPETTIGRERATNPFLQEAAPLAGPNRGM
ncbi:MBL fold metallo-hydrolase [Carbonactinospora thermoautotrophica]|uniref:Hydrolase n=1 Tax=Carbonactinospora thermoautotrophica TaxID=1469144 RepID=A0A132MS25_9ACTN|nr:MBL fold metallo-hydrolase [Carbonactinospora thermoautotrophica]KWX00667.1 Hydroxyacylglutathione hydrolase [Carbonactinospora thermoautotrophica]KWX05335.1 hydrolase [Carbonactinospora thermoautotrophica]KWX07072.1 hydrolase [Carbonactinospora thermoautotrophica]MCX9193048.1 MBL fold metallo-hydrolase [Carbonactinospora thermoautotrophica]